MTIKQLQQVLNVKFYQNVRIRDTRNQRTIETMRGWVLEPDYDYDGYNYEEIERILSLHVDSAEFGGDLLTIWAS